MDTITIDEARATGCRIHQGARVAFTDPEGRVRIGAIRIKEVKCGKKECTKCPHSRYAYAQYRDGAKVREKYIGVVR